MHQKSAAAVSYAVTLILGVVVFAMATHQNAAPLPYKTPPPVSQGAPKPVMLATVTLPPPPTQYIETPPAITAIQQAAPPKPVPRITPELTPLFPEKKPALEKKSATPSPEHRAGSPVDITLARREGRALLRILETGDGPSIEIAWPRNNAAREKLYTILTRCFRMQNAVLDGGGNLFDQRSPPGQPWNINRDLYSGFLRQPTGAIGTDERRIISAIKNRHGLIGGTPVRIFPRNVDAILLGHLNQLIGDRYQKKSTIRARYILTPTAIEVGDITVNGSVVPGIIRVGNTCLRT